MYHSTNVKSPGQLVFGQSMTLPINHAVDWRYIHQLKQAQTEKYIIRENTTRIDYDYRVRDQVMTRTKLAYKYETPFKGPYEKFQTQTNRTVTLQMVAVKMRINIRNMRPYNNPNAE